MVKNNDEYGFLIPENHQIHENAIQAMSFRDQVMAALGNPDDAIAKIKELTEISDLMAKAYNPLKAEPIEDGAYFKIGNHHYTELVCFAARIRNALALSLAESMSHNKVIENIESLKLFNIRVKEALYYSVIPSEVTDEEAIAKIEELKRNATYTLEQQNLETFWHKIQVLFGDTDIDFESAYRRIVDLLQNPDQFTGDKDREIERLNRDISGIASFLGLPEDTKQPDICFVIMKLKENQSDGKKALIERLHELLDQERSDSRNLCNQIADLRHDLLVAKKVIARLVGE
jgi:hypothetical protein